MTTHSITDNPVRSDVTGTTQPPPRNSVGNLRWALAGLGAGVTGIVAIVTAGMVDAVYQSDLQGDAAAIAKELEGQVPQMVAFHVSAVVSAVLMVVFAAGLYRRLHAVAKDSIAPHVAFSGLLGTAFVLILGSGLDTEFIAGFAYPSDAVVVPETAVLYNNWVGTIPWCWVLMGLSGLALFAVSRTGGVARWLGIVGLVGGGLTVLLGISPLQYMAGMTGPIWLTVVALGLLKQRD
jgi:hypothetical protein